MARYAVILKATNEVTEIKIMEGDNAPEINGDTAHNYIVEKVGPGVLIGMVKGGPNNAADGFGFPEGTNIGDRHGSGATKVAKPTAEEAGLASNHEKVRADEVNTAAVSKAPATTAPAKPAVKQESKTAA